MGDGHDHTGAHFMGDGHAHGHYQGDGNVHGDEVSALYADIVDEHYVAPEPVVAPVHH